MSDALAVFSPFGGHWADRWLEPGFLHVWCAIRRERFWVMVNAEAGVPVVQTITDSDYDLAEFYRDCGEGLTVVEVGPPQRLRLPLVGTNCVGMVKAVLGIRALGVVTPYQLYRRLIR